MNNSSRAAAAAVALAMAVSGAIDFLLLIRPMFGQYVPDFAGWDFANHVALVAGALETWRTTHAVPISSDQLVGGTEYPYFLFGNAGFYIIAALIGLGLNLPATSATACTLLAGLIVGQLGTYLFARSLGVTRVYAAVIGFLYATGPYLCVNLLVRADFPEFLDWELVPLLWFLGRRAMQAGASAPWLVALSSLMALTFYVHKLVGPHILLFEFLLILVNVRLSFGWFARLAALAVSLPCITVFAWLPLLRLSDQLPSLKRGSIGEIAVLNDSPVNYLWPWLQNSLAPAMRAPVYGDRFGLQLGLLASIGLVYGIWELCRSGFRPRTRELWVALIGGLAYSVLTLGADGLVQKLPFPLNSIQYSYRLIGLAFASGTIALVAALGTRPKAYPYWRHYAIPGAAAIAILVSTVTYWQPPGLTSIPLASLSPASLIDQSAFYMPSFRSLFGTSGAIGLDGSLSKRPWPIILGPAVQHVTPRGGDLLPTDSLVQPPHRLFLRGTLPAADFPPGGSPVVVRVYALQSSTSVPCATDTNVAEDRMDVISVLLDACAQQHVGDAGTTVSLSGGLWAPMLLSERSMTAPGEIDASFAVPDGVYFVAIECRRPPLPAPTSLDQPAPPACLNVDYFGQANQPDNTVQVPHAFPPETLTRGTFGQWTIRATNLPAGDYVLPTFDYTFVRITDEAGAGISSYQFDARPVIRFDGAGQTYTLWYDLTQEKAIFSVWAAALVVVGLFTWLIRRRSVVECP